MKPMQRSSNPIKRSLVVVMAVALSHFLSAALVAQTRYTVTEIVLPGGTNSHADGIDDLGRVVGGSEVAPNASPRVCSDYIGPDGLLATLLTSPEHAFLWVNGSITDLNPYLSGVSGASGINLAGHIVGRSTPSSDTTVVHGFLWTSPHHPTDLGTLPGGATNSNANAINDHDVIVGGSSAGDADPAPYYWNGSQMVEMNANSSTSAEATSVNNNGSVAGFASDQGEALFWHQPAEAPQLLAGDPAGLAFGVNNLGQVAGTVGPGACNLPPDVLCTTAALWQNGARTSLGTLVAGSASWANAINDHGKVVGFATLLQQNVPVERAFVWDAANGMRDLNSLITGGAGWKLERAVAINNPGQIVGCGRKSGRMRAFLLTPR